MRLRIQDAFRYEQELIYGDGSASAFKLRQGAPYSTLSGATASIFTAAALTGWSATGCSFVLDKGVVLFSGTPSAQTAILVDYTWSVFGTAEISHFTSVGGDVLGASIEAVKTLMFDAYKRNRWAAPDGSEVDDKQVMQNLKMLMDELRKEKFDDIGPAGAMASWSKEQKNY